ncbi:PEP-CTERM sorting domain-containing protein [Nitrosospira sp. Is2]|uniref:PEP-CTERM sorting domain-containing protein n=1 Tax=Nitrosospira sp. Is2 TaxID=3080532 RepID=UPI00295480C4|nr:PEP-CTERM sorting domain-containing protein [Nitrosospira sp. Is2]WON73955.1 PEP-CTERM sorting domain-containing protein [Nitrosospira sp. Is2]
MKIPRRVERRRLMLSTVLFVNLFFSAYAVAQQRSFLVDLNTRTATELTGLGRSTTAAAINDAGEVVGHSFVSRGNFHAFITGPNGVGMRSLGTLGGPVSQAFGINNSGQVVGYSHTILGETRAFITGPGGMGMRDIGTVGGSYSYAYDINATGQVVGSSHTSASEQHAIITNPNGLGMRDLGVFGSPNWAWGINDLGQAVGSSWVGAFITGPDGRGVRDLGTLGAVGSAAAAINNSGQAVGWSNTPTGASHAFITGPDGVGMRDLGHLGGNVSAAYGINEVGQVAGSSLTGGGHDHAFITGFNGVGMTDLNSLVKLPAGVILAEAWDINNMGQVIATTSLLIPEPESYLMFLGGLGLVGFMTWRKRLPV